MSSIPSERIPEIATRFGGTQVRLAQRHRASLSRWQQRAKVAATNLRY